MDPDRSQRTQTWRGVSWRGLVLVALLVAGCVATEEMASDVGEQVHWTYSGDHGPEHWGALSPSFSACSEGRSQSPIDIVDPIDVDLPPIELTHHGSTVAIQNNGHTLQIDVAPGSSLEVGDETFELAQLHAHSPSEHQIEGELFPLEAHFVHTNDRGELVVLSVLFREGEWNDGLATLGTAAPEKVGEAAPLAVRLSELALVPDERTYFRYEGSLTTPPCTEGVRWLVLEETRTISATQVARYVALIGEDARGPQPLNGRQVFR